LRGIDAQATDLAIDSVAGFDGMRVAPVVTCGDRSQWLEVLLMRSLIIASILILMKIEQVMLRRAARREEPD
jgi:hypothetical protein